MKRRLVLLFLLFTTFSIHTLVVTLKESVYTGKNTLTLRDVVRNPTGELPDVIIARGINRVKKLSARTILNELYNRNIYSVTLVGDTVTIYPENPSDNPVNLSSPVKYLNSYLSSYFNNDAFEIQTTILDIEPPLNIENIYDDFKWELNKINSSIDELANTHYLTLITGGRKYRVRVEFDIFTRIYIAREYFNSGDFLHTDGFNDKRVDITLYSDISDFVLNIHKANEARFVKRLRPGEVLRWSHIKRNAVFNKGETTRLIVKRDNIEVVIPCTVVEEGYENKKVKVKLSNGAYRFGVVKVNGGQSYVKL